MKQRIQITRMSELESITTSDVLEIDKPNDPNLYLIQYNETLKWHMTSQFDSDIIIVESHHETLKELLREIQGNYVTYHVFDDGKHNVTTGRILYTDIPGPRLRIEGKCTVINHGKDRVLAMTMEDLVKALENTVCSDSAVLVMAALGVQYNPGMTSGEYPDNRSLTWDEYYNQKQ